MDFYIGQIFENEYPAEVATWCSEQGNCHIEQIEDKIVDGTDIKQFQIIENYKQSADEKEAQFNKDFFLTSLGYIRRKVTMQNGETKDFLSDLLPVISMGVNSGQTVTVIAYSKPDFTLDEIVWTDLQSVQTVTAQFIQECFLQLSNDFTG